MDRELNVITVQSGFLSHRLKCRYKLHAFLGRCNNIEPVSMLGCGTQRPQPRAPNRNGRVRPLSGLRLTRGIVEVIVAAMEGGATLAPQKLHDHHRFVEAFITFGQRGELEADVRNSFAAQPAPRENSNLPSLIWSTCADAFASTAGCR